MAKIFISHSSKDKEFAAKLAEDLRELGQEPWLDEWEIKIGEDIVSKVEDGISRADYIIVILSPHSIESGWVEKEWKIRYWDEIEQKKTIVLPALLQDCEIPPLLKTKKYADFRKDYAVTLVKLMSSISPAVKEVSISKDIQTTNFASEISILLAKIQSRTTPLSQCIAEALIIAQKTEEQSLEQFCRRELTGWTREDEGSSEIPPYRRIEIFVSLYRINMQYVGWSSVSDIFAHMENDRNFFPHRALVPLSVSKIESKLPAKPQEGFISFEVPSKDLIPDPEAPDVRLIGYAKVDAYRDLLESIRTELTKRLLELLPEVEIKT